MNNITVRQFANMNNITIGQSRAFLETMSRYGLVCEEPTRVVILQPKSRLRKMMETIINWIEK